MKIKRNIDVCHCCSHFKKIDLGCSNGRMLCYCEHADIALPFGKRYYTLEVWHELKVMEECHMVMEQVVMDENNRNM